MPRTKEGMTHWPLSPNYQPYPMDASHPYIILENNRCILCRRCVRACGELIGNYTLGFEERGANSILVADTGVPLAKAPVFRAVPVFRFVPPVL